MPKDDKYEGETINLPEWSSWYSTEKYRTMHAVLYARASGRFLCSVMRKKCPGNMNLACIYDKNIGISLL